MNSLAFDCSTEIMALALRTESGSFSCVNDSGMKHAEGIMPAIEGALAECGISPAALDLVVCAKGPGSFTGLRIAMATAKGLCAGSGAAMVSVPTLDYLARPFSGMRGIVVPLIDARKGRVYAAAFEGGKLLGDYLDCGLEALLSRLESADRVLFTGPDADMAAEAAQARPGWELDRYRRSPRPECLIDIGMESLAAHGADEPGSSPLYLRESEADLGITISAHRIGALDERKRN